MLSTIGLLSPIVGSSRVLCGHQFVCACVGACMWVGSVGVGVGVGGWVGALHIMYSCSVDVDGVVCRVFRALQH